MAGPADAGASTDARRPENSASLGATIGARLRARRGFAPGSDSLRLAFAVMVVVFHAHVVVSHNMSLGASRLTWFPVYAWIPAFFALSGFLVAASAERLNVGGFLLARGLRIVPALLVEILACAFLLGPIFTSLPLADYFTAPGTWRYFTNVVGLINYSLPGVFTHLPAAGIVNLSLWTIPVELVTYAAGALLMACGLMRRPLALLGLLAAWLAGALIVDLCHLTMGHGMLPLLAERLFAGRGPRVWACALGGIVAYKLRDRLPYSPRLLIVALAAGAALAAWTPYWRFQSPAISALACAPIVYVTVFLAVSDLPRIPLLQRGDYSYGVYLYGFPIEQAVKALAPQLASPALLSLIALPPIFLFAAASWHCVERPVLRLRKSFSLAARARWASQARGAVLHPAE